MTLIKILIWAALIFMAVKFVASLFGKGNIPILNNLVTVILSLFVAFEFIKLGQILWEKLA